MRACAQGLAHLPAQGRKEHKALVPIPQLLPALQTGARSAAHGLRARHHAHGRQIGGDDILALLSARCTDGRPALALVEAGVRRDDAFRTFESAVEGLELPGLEPQAMATLREEVNRFDGPDFAVRFFGNPLYP